MSKVNPVTRPQGVNPVRSSARVLHSARNGKQSPPCGSPLVPCRDTQLKTSNGVNPVASGGNTDFVDILPCAKSTGHSSNGVKRAPEALKIRLIIMLT